jgi:hypothetical protein
MASNCTRPCLHLAAPRLPRVRLKVIQEEGEINRQTFWLPIVLDSSPELLSYARTNQLAAKALTVRHGYAGGADFSPNKVKKPHIGVPLNVKTAGQRRQCAVLSCIGREFVQYHRQAGRGTYAKNNIGSLCGELKGRRCAEVRSQNSGYQVGKIRAGVSVILASEGTTNQFVRSRESSNALTFLAESPNCPTEQLVRAYGYPACVFCSGAGERRWRL